MHRAHLFGPHLNALCSSSSVSILPAARVQFLRKPYATYNSPSLLVISHLPPVLCPALTSGSPICLCLCAAELCPSGRPKRIREQSSGVQRLPRQCHRTRPCPGQLAEQIGLHELCTRNAVRQTDKQLRRAAWGTQQRSTVRQADRQLRRAAWAPSRGARSDRQTGSSGGLLGRPAEERGQTDRHPAQAAQAGCLGRPAGA